MNNTRRKEISKVQADIASAIAALEAARDDLENEAQA